MPHAPHWQKYPSCPTCAAYRKYIAPEYSHLHVHGLPVNPVRSWGKVVGVKPWTDDILTSYSLPPPPPGVCAIMVPVRRWHPAGEAGYTTGSVDNRFCSGLHIAMHAGVSKRTWKQELHVEVPLACFSPHNHHGHTWVGMNGGGVAFPWPAGRGPGDARGTYHASMCMPCLQKGIEDCKRQTCPSKRDRATMSQLGLYEGPLL